MARNRDIRKSAHNRSLEQAISRLLSTSPSPGEGLGQAGLLLSEQTLADAVQINALGGNGERVIEIYSSGNLSSLFPSGLRRPAHGSSMRTIASHGPISYSQEELTAGTERGVEDFAVFISAGYRYLVAAPVRLQGKTLGAVQLLSSKPLKKDAVEILQEAVPLLAPYVALFMTLVDSAVEDRISQSIERVAEAVIQENSVQGVCEAVVTFARGSMGIDAAVLRVKDLATDELRIEYTHGHVDPADVAGNSFRMVELSLIPKAVELGGPLIVDEGTPGVFNDMALLPLFEELPSILVTPLMDRGELLGTIEFYSLNEYAYRAEHLRNVEHVANLLTSAVEHFRLIRSLSREAEIRSLLADVARLASAADDLISLVESISPGLRKVIPVDRITYYLPPERFQPNAADAAGKRHHARFLTSDGLAKVLAAGPEHTPCGATGPDTSRKSTCGAQNCIEARLWDESEDKRQGWIHLERAGPPFTKEERGLVPEIARHIAPAIDTALSHEAELRLAQQQLRAERAEAEVQHQQRLNDAKQNFIATMSHELRTPLTSIRAFTDLLNRKNNTNLTERQKKQLSVVRRNSEWLNILINDLLDLSSIDSGRFELQFEDVDISAMLEGVVESFGPIAEVENHKLKAILPGRSVNMTVDPNRVSQVLGNLLTNAMKFSPTGTEIRLLARPAKDGVRFFVRDEGPGIPVEQQEIVFDRFVRAKSEASKRARGTGIGLYVSKMIVEGHGGCIGVTSTVDSHTTMHFWLPCKRPEAQGSAKEERASEAA